MIATMIESNATTSSSSKSIPVFLVCVYFRDRPTDRGYRGLSLRTFGVSSPGFFITSVVVANDGAMSPTSGSAR